MVAFFVTARVAGILLALRFKAFVLVRATLLVAIAVIASGYPPRITMALTLLGTVALLQVGYFAWLDCSRALPQTNDGALRPFVFNVNGMIVFLESERHDPIALDTSVRMRA